MQCGSKPTHQEREAKYQSQDSFGFIYQTPHCQVVKVLCHNYYMELCNTFLELHFRAHIGIIWII